MQNMNRREKKTKSKVSTIIKEITGEKKTKEKRTLQLPSVLGVKSKGSQSSQKQSSPVTDGPDETLVAGMLRTRREEGPTRVTITSHRRRENKPKETVHPLAPLNH
jgi:hypothetical protein